MELIRLYHSLRIMLIPNSKKRVEYLKKKNVFHSCGENVYFQTRKIPLYANLITFHNNIRIASNVTFITHDVIGSVLERATGKKYSEKLGCIEICDNVFIGSNTVIMYNTKIGPNVIIAAGSVVTRDVPAGEVWGGVPARKIGEFDKVAEKRAVADYPQEIKSKKQRIGKKLEQLMWEKFYTDRNE